MSVKPAFSGSSIVCTLCTQNTHKNNVFKQLLYVLLCPTKVHLTSLGPQTPLFFILCEVKTDLFLNMCILCAVYFWQIIEFFKNFKYRAAFRSEEQHKKLNSYVIIAGFNIFC